MTRGDKFVSVANATEDDIEVVIDETTLVRKDHTTGKKFRIGATPLAGAAKLEVLFAFIAELILFLHTLGCPWRHQLYNTDSKGSTP